MPNASGSVGFANHAIKSNGDITIKIMSPTSSNIPHIAKAKLNMFFLAYPKLTFTSSMKDIFSPQ
jgi:hypothetical protein